MSDADTKQSSQGSPFWRFSLRLYREAGVADACIALQEESGVDVNLLMYMLWRATERRSLAAGDVAWIENKIGPWRDATVVPLRSVRRALKVPPALVAAGPAEAFRTRVKALELEAERLQQEAMFAFGSAAPPGTLEPTALGAARKSLDAYQTICRAPFRAADRDAVLNALIQMNPPEL